MAQATPSEEGLAPDNSSDEPTQGFKGTPPVENIDDTAGDVSDDFSEEFSELALEMLEDDGEILPDPEPEPDSEVLAEHDDEVVKDDPAPEPDKEEPADEPPKEEGEEVPSQEPEPEPLTPAEQAAAAQKAQEDASAARTELLGQIEESITFTEDEIERLKTEPEKVLPKRLAQIYLDVHSSVMQSVQQQMPQMIQMVQQQQATQTKTIDAFQKSWKSLDLNNADHMAVVGRVGATYRQLNPKASQEQFIREVGAQAMIALGIPLTAAMGLVEPQDEVTQEPYKPAQGGSVTPVPKAKSDNDFESLAEEFLLDDMS